MISTVARVTAWRVSTRAVPRFSRGMMTIGDQLKSKKKVEEERYIKAQEAARAKLVHDKQEAEQKVVEATEAEKHYDEVIVPVMDEISGLLGKTGDSVSPEALEALAKWKLGE